MEKRARLWFARLIVIVFLGITLVQLVAGRTSVWLAMRAVWYYAVLLAGYRFGAANGAVAGAVFGIAETLRSGDMAPLGILCLMGVLAGSFRSLGRLASAAAYLCGALGIGALYAAEYLAGSLPGILTATTLFLLTPESFLQIRKEEKGGPGSWEELQRHRLKEAADSYGKLSRSLLNLKPGERQLGMREAQEAVGRASSMVCGGCRQCRMGRLTGSDGLAESLDFEQLCTSFQEKGNLEAGDLPEDFSRACRRSDLYLETLVDCLGSVDYEEGWKSRFFESREAASLQFREMERTLMEMAAQLDQAVDVTEAFEKKVRRSLRRRHLKLEQLLVLEGEDARQEAYVTIGSGYGGCMTVKELGETVGKSMSRNLKAVEGGRSVVGREPCTIRLVEDTRYRLLSGVARVCKEDEELSGDNFSCHSLPDGHMMLCLSDGMGSGRRAFLESELVMELLEELLDAGFSPERAIYMLNALLLVREEEQTMATLDLVLINLYTGQARFFKQGAVSTFIRRGDRVLQIEPGSLPMGIDCNADPLSVDVLLEDEDMIVMVTDGVLDALEGEDKEGAMSDFLARTQKNNARELAEEVLQAGWSKDQPARDDMTVLTAGFWKK
ncbi:MAG: SpoIIE family protein phosphatase [Lachnospiraceae bacterium]|jgi:stage II sporulation protein E|nr:SpoIIE family protein phosphatase [Lachnospiraceae bacterium]